MKDRNGLTVEVGQRAFVIPNEREGRRGGVGWVHAVKPCAWNKGKPAARVSDNKDDDLEKMRWGAWCQEDELEVIP